MLVFLQNSNQGRGIIFKFYSNKNLGSGYSKIILYAIP